MVLCVAKIENFCPTWIQWKRGRDYRLLAERTTEWCQKLKAKKVLSVFNQEYTLFTPSIWAFICVASPRNCKELTHWKRLWCWDGLGAGGEGDDRGWDGWMASPTRWTWVWVNSGSWWWTGRPSMLQFMGSQRDMTEWLNWTELNKETGGSYPQAWNFSEFQQSTFEGKVREGLG